ncbi:hypothetical protein MtrunA17_Chr8g0359901 [Medicago truncatula]|uniref:Uncharacterized protein n=1 Tax=Medicago truncatula TaxID=3880 RepID=A0A396GK29_MEDTR|nr:hypothetical protein MtrunA17_Chr8g0359901 [Medicago truncatula]
MEPTLSDWNTDKHKCFQETVELGPFEILLCIYIEACSGSIVSTF